MNLEELEKRLGTTFRDKNLLQQALTHSSWKGENQGIKPLDYEKLEYLGDAVLLLAIRERLIDLPYPEGKLTDFEAYLKSNKNLLRAARTLNLRKYLSMGKGLRKHEGLDKSKTMADVVEALLGAIYLDLGLSAAKDFVNQYVLDKLDKVINDKLYLHPKLLLQELSQEKLHATPSYETIEMSGPDHSKTSIVAVMISGREVGRGKGTSKQEASERAAIYALRKEFNINFEV